MKKIKFNLKAIGKSYLSVFIIIIVLSLFDSVVSINKWLGGILIFSGFFVPFILGQKLFLKQNEINPT